MMGMGFLRLNKILARHKWHRKNDNEREEQEYEGSSLSLWLVVIALIVVSALIFGAVRISHFL